MTQLTGHTQVAGQPLFSSSATQHHVLGEEMVTPDGRHFRYAKAGELLVVGNVLQGPAQTTDTQSLVVAAAAIGATTVTTTDTTTVTANEFAGGYLFATGEAGTGRGEVYRIKSHPAATTAVVTFTLEDPIRVAFSSSTQIDVVHNPYLGVIQNPATESGTPIGVASYPIAANQYGWIQTKGIASVLANGALTVGLTVVAGGSTAGAVQDIADGAAELLQQVGWAATGVATTENGAVYLNLP